MSVPIYLNDKLKEVLIANKVDPLGYSPAYGESAGLDLYYTGEEELHFMHDRENPSILDKDSNSWKEVKLIPTGLHVAIPKGYVGLILDRGSIIKTSLIRRAGVVDPGYTNEVFVNIVNPGPGTHTLKPGSKLPLQLVVVVCDNEFVSVSREEYDAHMADSKRKGGHVGSSD